MWAQRNIKYVREYPETYASPQRTLHWRIGDCDDIASFICATLRGVRIPCQLVFVGWQEPTNTKRIPYKHVFAQAFINGAWVPLEAVRPVPFGWSPIDYHKSQGMNVRYAVHGDKETGVQ